MDVSGYKSMLTKGPGLLTGLSSPDASQLGISITCIDCLAVIDSKIDRNMAKRSFSP